ncbi:hypothetical protein HCG51_15975 [Tolypothrix sp. PCC 7910]|uniref:hypothetical protein n=1 Tax=Tolypothrix sp. PCC 7910 TaxID=2099387 RepID=UPI0014279E17|nr:hypothetical protein [Tolypothrix sp. PCC 7910]QIR38055.1 hypothetical protein HCG51_15975 [Tolypothrix sp. PCC 7910]
MLSSTRNLFNTTEESIITQAYYQQQQYFSHATRLVLSPPKQVAIAVTQLLASRIPLLLLVYDKH